MTRNLVIYMVPTVLAFFAIYWLKRRKKAKAINELASNGLQLEEKSSLECASSSDLDNTLSDASSFTSPRNSEKSSETDSPLFDSPLHVRDGHCNLISPGIIENACISYASADKEFLTLKGLRSSILADSKQPFRSDTLNDSEMLKATNSSFQVKNNSPENCLQKKVECENLEALMLVVETDKTIETDCHSSAYDDNSLSYASDDSDGKQFLECKNKGSLSSVLDENSLLSSFCDELEKSSASNSPLSKSNHSSDNGLDSSKDAVDTSFKVSSIDIKNYTDSYHSKLSDLEKLIKESSVHVSNSSCPNLSDSYQIFKNEQFPFGWKAFSESSTKDLNRSNLRVEVNENSFDISNNYLVQNDLSEVKKSSRSEDLVKNNLSDFEEPSLVSNDSLTNDSKTLNTDAAFENEIEQPSYSVVASGDIVCHSTEKRYNKMTNFSVNTNTSSVTYASILTSKINNSSADTASCIIQQISSEMKSSPSKCTKNELLKSNLNWPLPSSKSILKSNSEIETDLCSSSNQTFNKMKGEILPSKSYCEIKTNSGSPSANRNSNSTHQKDNPLDSSCEDSHKQCNKLESNGFFEQKSSKEYVYEFELPQELCGRLIGKHGRNVKSIMEHSNANVFIKHHPYDPLLKVVVVEGHRADVNEALEIIRRKYPPSMFPAVTLVQTNVLSSTGVPMPESLQLHLPEGASCDVILSSLVSAGHFFLQQPTHPTYPSLSTLDQCMINLYSQVDTPLLPQPIEAGVICAAPVYRGWYRAQVVYVCDNSSDCGIKFVDYGGFSQVPISSLRQIRSDFMSLPFQASECYLAQVQPLGGDTWSSEATSVFEELAQGQILQALLVEYADDGIPCVYLYRVQGVSSTFINKELVERGLAEWVGNSNHWDPH